MEAWGSNGHLERLPEAVSLVAIRMTRGLRPQHGQHRRTIRGQIIEEVKEMPEFGSSFSGLASHRKLTKGELVRAIRFMVAAEYEAVQLYVQLAESIDDQLAIAVLRDIADEERVHAGEFLRLLYHLAPDEAGLYEKGAKEVEEIMEEIRRSSNG